MATGKDAALAFTPGSTGLTRSAVALSAPTFATNSETPAASLAYAISIGADTYALAPAFPVAPDELWCLHLFGFSISIRA